MIGVFNGESVIGGRTEREERVGLKERKGLYSVIGVFNGESVIGGRTEREERVTGLTCHNRANVSRGRT